MQRKQTWFIVIGVVLIVLISGGFYVNYQLDHLVAALNRPGWLFVETESEDEALTVGLEEEYEYVDTQPGSKVNRDHRVPSAGSNQDGTGSNAPGETPSSNGDTRSVDARQESPPASNQQVASGVQDKVGKPIEKTDLIKAGLIIIRKLDGEEISYLYRVGNKDSYTKEELKRSREILLGKLTPEDINTLRELGGKYGKTLRVLDASVPIE